MQAYAHTHTKRFSGVGISHEPRLSESTDIHAATQHKTNPSSDDDNRTHHWAIEQKGPDRGVDAVPVAERRQRRRRRPGELASGRRWVWIGNAESSSAQGRTLGGQRRRSGPRRGGGLLESRECWYLYISERVKLGGDGRHRGGEDEGKRREREERRTGSHQFCCLSTPLVPRLGH